jgi:hypothetical protein
MLSDIIAYALLAIIFVFTGLRMFVEKPNQIRGNLFLPQRKPFHRTRDRQPLMNSHLH